MASPLLFGWDRGLVGAAVLLVWSRTGWWLLTGSRLGSGLWTRLRTLYYGLALLLLHLLLLALLLHLLLLALL